MVTITEITSKTIQVNYKKEDIEGYAIAGSATYDKNDAVVNADGAIVEVATNLHVANFNTYGTGEDARINLTNCLAGMMGEAVEIAETTLADLAKTRPEA